MYKIKKKDMVVIKTGKDKGKQGEVVRILPSSNRAVVNKINVSKKHVRPTRTDPGGVMDVEMPVHISNLALLCSKCGQTSKVKTDRLENGEKVRVCKKCGEMIV
ncbi:MAG: 50S ribosomal protein L24 [Elusimicrobiota bacterium]